MIISDEKLSAFLDAELPEREMEAIRQAIGNDETLANRLAELAMVDEQLAQHYAAIDARPLPDAIADLLASAPAETRQSAPSATIIAFPLWKKIHRGLQQHAAVAACTALVVGFGLAQLMPGNRDAYPGDWNALTAALDTATSGTEQALGSGQHLKPRLTFINEQGQFCRQFVLRDSNMSTETIACRVGDKWQPGIAVYTQTVSRDGDYQTATSSSVLDQVLDDMMQGDALDAQAEAQAIQRGWKHD